MGEVPTVLWFFWALIISLMRKFPPHLSVFLRKDVRPVRYINTHFVLY